MNTDIATSKWWRDTRRRTGLSSVLFTAAACFATVGALLGLHSILSLAAAALIGFVFLEFPRIPRVQKIAALILLALAAVLAGISRPGEVATILFAGVLKTLPFLLVFAAVGWLRAAASESPSVTALRAGLANLGAGRRFAAFSLSAHAMGAGFNLAGVGLLAPMLDDARDGPWDAMRLRCAIMWGFAAATCWSPFFVGTAAVLATMPSLQWRHVLPYGIVLAVGFLAYAIAYDRFMRRRTDVRAPPPVISRPLAVPASRLLAAIAVLFAITLALVEGVGLALTTAIALAGPAFALCWLLLVHGTSGRAKIGKIAGNVILGYPGMRTETTLFVAANVFGAAISASLPVGGLTADGIAAPPMGDFGNTLLAIWLYLAICALGFHPIVLLVVFTTMVDPASLGVPLPVLGATMMTLWGMGTSVSPLSGTTLFLSQMSQASSFTIAWRWNGVFFLSAAIWPAAVLAIAS
ncbi:hypothetical protein [Tropicimonas marinistellae]|uniref:hypothetical protein n=1 Tax=Tropicimonas marinistellae TaxID=1739787 RepID=UPI00082D3E61|nr:hypothetical protein [Tropicimonas marinistellae]